MVCNIQSHRVKEKIQDFFSSFLLEQPSNGSLVVYRVECNPEIYIYISQLDKWL